ncbi:hypothetical protein BDZ89DRAFT_1148343 [Hymenopellis radicata]|nr:hypothetical protein BDZ89DRAFT_1148343 [Hymenopellis radicata]
MHKINRPSRELSLLEAAEKAHLSRSAFQRLSALLQEKFKKCPSLETRPNPSNNPSDPLNLAVQCLQALRTSLDRGLLELVNFQAASSLLVDLYPSVTAWVEYCIHHIVIPDRTDDQFFGLQTLLSSIIMHYCTHPFLYPASPPQDGSVYMPALIPLLFHTHHLACAQVQYDMLSDLLKSIVFMMEFHGPDGDTEPMWHIELYQALVRDVDSLISAYIAVTTTLLDVFQLVDNERTADDWLRRLHRVHSVTYFIRLEKYSQDSNGGIDKLYERGQYRLVYRCLSLMASSKLLHRLVYDTIDNVKAKMQRMDCVDHCTITNIWDCLSVMANTLPASPGLPTIQLAYEEQFLPSLFKLDRLVAHFSACSETIREDHAYILTKSVHPFIRYLCYYSTMELARKTRRQIMQFSGVEEVSGTWKSYFDRIAELEEAHDTYEMNPPAICDADDCPNRQMAPDKLMGCAGCGMKFLYCSRACQRKDWLAGHREKCMEIRRSTKANHGYPDTASSRDLHFLETLIQQYIVGFRNEDPAMVRVVDFTQPTKVEATLVDPEKYRGSEPNLDTMIAFARAGGGVMVHHTGRDKIQFMSDTGRRPVYIPHNCIHVHPRSTNCPG